MLTAHPSLFHSTPTPPNTWRPKNLAEVKVTKITRFLCPLRKSEEENPTKGERVEHIPHRYQLLTAMYLTLENPSRLAEKAARKGSQRRAGALVPGRKGQRTATSRKLDSATCTAHGTGCFTIIFFTETSKAGPIKNCVFLLSLLSISVTKYNCKDSTIRLSKSNIFPI